MVIIQNGLNRVRDLLDTDLIDARAGTDTTLPTEADTGLVTPVAATEFDVTTTKADKAINVSHVIPSTSANGNDLTEWEIRMNSEATSFNRTVTAVVSKNSSIEVHRLVTVFLRNGQ